MSARSRLSLFADTENRMLILRYFGDLEGGEVNVSMMDQLASVAEPWTYDAVIDLRRHSGVIMAQEIQDLGLSWAHLAKGRDKGRWTAVISVDPLVKARFSQTAAAFPFRHMELFQTFDEGLEWIDTQRCQAQRDVA